MKIPTKPLTIILLLLLLIGGAILYLNKNLDPLYVNGFTYGEKEYIGIAGLMNKGKFDIKITGVEVNGKGIEAVEFGYSETRILTSADLVTGSKDVTFSPLSKQSVIKHDSDTNYGLRIQGAEPLKKVIISYNYLFFHLKKEYTYY